MVIAASHILGVLPKQSKVQHAGSSQPYQYHLVGKSLFLQFLCMQKLLMHYKNSWLLFAEQAHDCNDSGIAADVLAGLELDCPLADLLVLAAARCLASYWDALSVKMVELAVNLSLVLYK